MCLKYNHLHKLVYVCLKVGSKKSKGHEQIGHLGLHGCCEIEDVEGSIDYFTEDFELMGL